MSWGTIQRGVHQPNISFSRNWNWIVRKEALRHMRRIERQAMENSITYFDRGRVFVQKVDVRSQFSICIVIQQCIVVAPNQHRGHASF